MASAFNVTDESSFTHLVLVIWS